MEQILPDSNISESDPLANVANNSSTLIFRTLQYIFFQTDVPLNIPLKVQSGKKDVQAT